MRVTNRTSRPGGRTRVLAEGGGSVGATGSSLSVGWDTGVLSMPNMVFLVPYGVVIASWAGASGRGFGERGMPDRRIRFGRRTGAAIARSAQSPGGSFLRSAAAALCRGLPGLAESLVAEAEAAVGTAGDDGIGLPHLRTAARALVGPEVAADATPLLRAAARTPTDPDGTFPRSALAIALARAGAAADRGFAPERDPALVAAGRGRLRFADDGLAARLLLSEFGWTFHRA